MGGRRRARDWPRHLWVALCPGLLGSPTPALHALLPAPPRQVHSHWLSETTPPPTLLVSVLGLQTHVWLLEKSPRTGTTMACPQNLAAATGLTGGVKAVSLVPF